MEILLAVLIKPFVALLILVPVHLICGALWRLLPDSKFKRVLFSPLSGHHRRWG